MFNSIIASEFGLDRSGVKIKKCHRIKGLLMHGVSWFGKAGQNVRVDQIIHSPRPA
jgi:hypothetical protein